MQYIAASLGVQCNYCHVQGDNASDDKDTKKTARKMMQMVSDLNTQFFAGNAKVSCASCHNGHPKPSKVSPVALNMAVTTEKFADVKINAPVQDSVFAKPAPQ